MRTVCLAADPLAWLVHEHGHGSVKALPVLLVVPVDLEYDRLALHVLNKRPGMELKDS